MIAHSLSDKGKYKVERKCDLRKKSLILAIFVIKCKYND